MGQWSYAAGHKRVIMHVSSSCLRPRLSGPEGTRSTQKAYIRKLKHQEWTRSTGEDPTYVTGSLPTLSHHSNDVGSDFDNVPCSERATCKACGIVHYLFQTSATLPLLIRSLVKQCR